MTNIGAAQPGGPEIHTIDIRCVERPRTLEKKSLKNDRLGPYRLVLFDLPIALSVNNAYAPLDGEDELPKLEPPDDECPEEDMSGLSRATTIGNVMISLGSEKTNPTIVLDRDYGREWYDRLVMASLGGMSMVRALNHGSRSATFQATEGIVRAWDLVQQNWGAKFHTTHGARFAVDLSRTLDQVDRDQMNRQFPKLNNFTPRRQRTYPGHGDKACRLDGHGKL